MSPHVSQRQLDRNHQILFPSQRTPGHRIQAPPFLLPPAVCDSRLRLVTEIRIQFDHEPVADFFASGDDLGISPLRAGDNLGQLGITVKILWRT